MKTELEIVIMCRDKPDDAFGKKKSLLNARAVVLSKCSFGKDNESAAHHYRSCRCSGNRIDES